MAMSADANSLKWFVGQSDLCIYTRRRQISKSVLSMGVLNGLEIPQISRARDSISRYNGVTLFPSLSFIPLHMSEYDVRPGGSLKLKGGVIDGGIVKKYVKDHISSRFSLNPL